MATGIPPKEMQKSKKIRTPFRIYCQKEFLLFIIYLFDVGGILFAPSLTERRPKLISRVL